MLSVHLPFSFFLQTSFDLQSLQCCIERASVSNWLLDVASRMILMLSHNHPHGLTFFLSTWDRTNGMWRQRGQCSRLLRLTRRVAATHLRWHTSLHWHWEGGSPDTQKWNKLEGTQRSEVLTPTACSLARKLNAFNTILWYIHLCRKHFITTNDKC